MVNVIALQNYILIKSLKEIEICHNYNECENYSRWNLSGDKSKIEIYEKEYDELNLCSKCVLDLLKDEYFLEGKNILIVNNSKEQILFS